MAGSQLLVESTTPPRRASNIALRCLRSSNCWEKSSLNIGFAARRRGCTANRGLSLYRLAGSNMEGEDSIIGGVKLLDGGETGGSRMEDSNGDGLEWILRDSEDVFKGEGDLDWFGLEGFKVGSENLVLKIGYGAELVFVTFFCIRQCILNQLDRRP